MPQCHLSGVTVAQPAFLSSCAYRHRMQTDFSRPPWGRTGRRCLPPQGPEDCDICVISVLGFQNLNFHIPRSDEGPGEWLASQVLFTAGSHLLVYTKPKHGSVVLTCNKKCARTAPRDMGQNSPAVTQRSRRQMQ